MPLACSESAPLALPSALKRLLGGLTALSVAFTIAPGPIAAKPPSNWGRASFPAAVFAGYSSPFGLRVHPITGGLRPHQGLDIAAPLGSPVRNWWDGRLVAILQDSGCGSGLVIQSGPYEHVYCHLAGQSQTNTYRSGAVSLRLGQWLRTGQTIGHVGNSGSTTGSHLHWGLRHGNRWLDPADVLRAMAADRRQQRRIWRRAFNVETSQ